MTVSNYPDFSDPCDRPVDTLKGVGPKSKEAFAQAGIESIKDLLSYYPRAYDALEKTVPIASLSEGETAAVEVSLKSPLSGRFVRGLSILSGLFCDRTGEISVTWYRMPYLRKTIIPGKVWILRGTLKKKGKRLLLEQPAVFSPEQYEALRQTLRPVYSLVRGLTGTMISKAVRCALDDPENYPEYMPEHLLEKNYLCSLSFALEQIHFPTDRENLIRAHNRLAFDEFFFFLLQLSSLREKRDSVPTCFRMHPAENVKKLLSFLPYELTDDQKKVWDEIESGLAGETVMSRLIQGDVGSGKTILAVMALLTAAENGFQGALMAPTEVLARQHAASVRSILESLGMPFESVLLTGSLTAAQKREAYAKISSGEAKIVIGTHALIQESVAFSSLALVITDEQHRFGVKQREILSEKGREPHVLVMSATPIPRTLAVILYGDLDISVIRQMPSERIPIRNCVVGPSYRDTAYRFILRQVEAGHQAYVICPLAAESEGLEAEDVVTCSEKLRTVFPENVRISYLHGKLKPSEKNEIMEDFLAGKIQILVSTTVVEVGVNVPNATVMMVENAERFGLAQLHQLRGRVGRGSAQSYCIFMQTSENETARERLDILNHSNDGFEIASRDLSLRGPGDLFGLRQSGFLEFSLADVYTDASLLQEAAEDAKNLIKEDPDLSRPEHERIRRKLEKTQSGGPNLSL